MKLSPKQLQLYVRDPVQLIAEQLVLEDGQPFGESMADFQRRFFQAVFATHPDGRPVHRLVYDERRRGESKSSDAASAAIGDLLVGPPGHRSYCVAADADQAELILDSVRAFQSRSPMLDGLRIQKMVVVNEATDSRLRVMSSDDRTAFGIRPRKIFFDELSLQPDDRLWNAMWSAIGKNPKSQMVSLSMAGWDFSSLGWRIRELAAKTEDYYFHTREGSQLAPWLSPDDMEEQERTLHPADYARFWLCKWTEPLGSWITRAMFEACVTGQESPRAADGQVSVGFVDVGLVHDPTAVAVTHRDGDQVVLDTLRTLQGSRTAPLELEVLEELVAELTQRHHVRHWLFEAPQAVASAQRLQRRLRGAQVEVRYPTVETQANLFGTLYRLFTSRQLVLFPHEQLRKEALSLATKTVGGRIKVVQSSAIHQDHVIAVGGAAEMALASQATANSPEDVAKFKRLQASLGGGSSYDRVVGLGTRRIDYDRLNG